jgi:ferredoxin
MKLRVDPELCTGHGRCYALAPDVFSADEFGHCELRVVEIDDADKALLEQARLGVENCPERAIALEPE